MHCAALFRKKPLSRLSPRPGALSVVTIIAQAARRGQGAGGIVLSSFKPLQRADPFKNFEKSMNNAVLWPSFDKMRLKKVRR